MRGKLVSLKVDSAVRYSRHVLGVNAQYELDGRMVCRTLAMLEVHESQTAKFLKNRILDVLKRYHLPLEQIFSITTDNGANMLAAAKKLQQEFAMLQSQVEHGTTDDEDDTAEDNFIEALMAELTEQFNIIRCAIRTLGLALNDVITIQKGEIQSYF
ncbi:uncharacterized protein LOC134214750 [Armigeres subalbatus]|uniref:uncharacterized protein LOC134214750 n=1 Tax=Armigeres subalbatus TaxID=124917 RepID=UPI002ED41A29